jgi:hypothetical protein|tara:strand:- start:615 stop:851 length:237 start_codon:yes stop_codon:yes gene_type:complete
LAKESETTTRHAVVVSRVGHVTFAPLPFLLKTRIRVPTAHREDAAVIGDAIAAIAGVQVVSWCAGARPRCAKMISVDA